MASENDDVLWLHAQARLTVVELAELSGMPRPILDELIDSGALAPDEGATQAVFRADCVARLRTAARLREDFELEATALGLVLAYLERIERLEVEVRRLRAQIAR